MEEEKVNINKENNKREEKEEGKCRGAALSPSKTTSNFSDEPSQHVNSIKVRKRSLSEKRPCNPKYFVPQERKTKVGRPKKGEEITKARIAKELNRWYGLQFMAAHKLGCSEANLSRRINADPELLEIQRAARERNKDQAEFNILKNLYKTKPEDESLQIRASFKYLDRIAKDRGYGEGPGIQINEMPVQINIAPVSQVVDAEVIEEGE